MCQAYHLAEWKKSGHEAYLSGFLSPLEVKDNSDVLDIGCGSGYVNRYLGSRRNLHHNFGIDFDLEAVLLARQLNADSNTISWVCASAEAIPLPAESVDHVICRAVLPYVAVEQAVAEIARVLRGTGTVVLLLHAWTFYLRWPSIHPPSWKQSLSGMLHFLLGLWFNLTGKQIRIRWGQHRIGQTFQTEYRMRRLLGQHGLKLYHVVPKPEFLVYAAKSPDGAFEACCAPPS